MLGIVHLPGNLMMNDTQRASTPMNEHIKLSISSSSSKKLKTSALVQKLED
jgi:hypothetical protein